MNPLSAIRQFVMPTPQVAIPGNAPLAPGKPILPAELEQLQPLQLPGATRPVNGTQESFGATLAQFVQEVNAKQLNSREHVSALQRGEDIPLHQVVIAMEEASVSFQLMVEVRNKLLESYQELMRMQI